jgi:hypothetical protein
MKPRLINYGIVLGAMAGVMALLFVSLHAAQDKAPAANAAVKAVPRTADGHPDFSGFYAGFVSGVSQAEEGEAVLTRANDGSIFFDYAGANEPQLAATKESENQPSYKPEYYKKVDELAKSMYGGNTTQDPQYDCKPLGVPRASIGLIQIVQSPKTIAILFEAAPGPVYRLIYTDGRQHPKDLDTSYFGHSIGHWEGDTLVVDTVGLNDETWLGVGQDGADNHTSLHSDKEHVIERWSRQGDTLTLEATVEDPVMFTKPWVIRPRRTKLATPDDYIQPQMCIAYSKDHLIKPSEKDPKLICGWCTTESLYGGDGNKITTVEKKKKAGGE